MKRRIFLVVIGLIIFIGGIFLIKTFFLGNPMPVSRIFIGQIFVNDFKIETHGDFVDSALAYKSFKYRTDGDAVYIKIYRVLVSPFHKFGNFKISIEGDFSAIKRVFLEDEQSRKQIWGE